MDYLRQSEASCGALWSGEVRSGMVSVRVRDRKAQDEDQEQPPTVEEPEEDEAAVEEPEDDPDAEYDSKEAF